MLTVCPISCTQEHATAGPLNIPPLYCCDHTVGWRPNKLLRCALFAGIYQCQVSACSLKFASRSADLHRSGWLNDTFIDPCNAETALVDDRPRFLSREGAERLTPRHIWQLIRPDREVAQVYGFARLFEYLDDCRPANELRQLVMDHFIHTPYLEGHLHPHIRRLSLRSI